MSHLKVTQCYPYYCFKEESGNISYLLLFKTLPLLRGWSIMYASTGLNVNKYPRVIVEIQNLIRVESNDKQGLWIKFEWLKMEYMCWLILSTKINLKDAEPYIFSASNSAEWLNSALCIVWSKSYYSLSKGIRRQWRSHYKLWCVNLRFTTSAWIKEWYCKFKHYMESTPFFYKTFYTFPTVKDSIVKERPPISIAVKHTMNLNLKKPIHYQWNW